MVQYLLDANVNATVFKIITPEFGGSAHVGVQGLNLYPGHIRVHGTWLLGVYSI